MNMVTIFCDGACSGNPGKGAYTCITYIADRRTVYDAIVGYEDGYDGIHAETYKDTTNNRMEIKALIEALHLATTKYKSEVCTIYCDSAYCVNIFNN
jgi:ribonuclease HI